MQLPIACPLILFLASSAACWSQQTPPKLIDCHLHHNGSPEFLNRLLTKLESLNGMAMLIVEPKDLHSVTDFMHVHPGRLIGLGQIDLDAPDVLETVDRFHQSGFRGLGELTKPKYSYDDRRYWPVYERAESYRMIILFHTGIVNRTNPEVAADVSSDRMRVSTLDLVARRFPKLTILGAHLGNPDYAWAGEVGRWNPNVYFDVSGSTLIKKQEDSASSNRFSGGAVSPARILLRRTSRLSRSWCSGPMCSRAIWGNLIGNWNAITACSTPAGCRRRYRLTSSAELSGIS